MNVQIQNCVRTIVSLPHGSLFLILQVYKLKVQITTSPRIMVHVISHWFHSPSAVCATKPDSVTLSAVLTCRAAFREANMLTAGTGDSTLSAHTTSFRATTAGSHWWKKASRMAAWLYGYFFCMIKIEIGHAGASLHAEGCLHGTSINYLMWVFFY